MDSKEMLGKDMLGKRITNEDKMRAIEGMRADMGKFIKSQERQDDINNNLLKRLTQILVITSIILFSSLTVLVYFIFKPADANKASIHYFAVERAYLLKEGERQSKERADLSVTRKELIKLDSILKTNTKSKTQ